MPTASQPSPPSFRDPALDGLRGVAILLVFLFHYGGGLRAHSPLLHALGYLTQAGWIGVDLFFALSGFLITGILARTVLSGPNPHANAPFPHAFRNFYARRALRILPLYFAALLACGATALLTGATLLQLKPLLIYAAFLQNLPPLLNTALQTPPPLPVFHLWSLAVEEQFYLLWPVALLLARTPRRAFRLSLGTFAASCLFRAFVFAPHLFSWQTANTFATFLPTRAGALALGSALALHLHFHTSSATSSIPNPEAHGEEAPLCSRRRPRGMSLPLEPSLLAATVAVALILLTALHAHTLLLSNRPSFLFTLPAADLLSATLVALTLQPSSLRSLLSTRPLAFLGRISYGFYVLHILLEPLFDRLGTVFTHAHTGFAYQTARLIAAFLLTTLAAWLSFTLLERPFLRLKRRFPRTPPGLSSASEHAVSYTP